MNFIAQNWKTSVQAVLTVVMGVSTLTSTPQLAFLTPKQSAGLFVAGALAKVLLGLFQTDGITLPGGSTIKQTTDITTPAETK